MPAPARRLLITADDFGVGVETSRGILDLAARGVVSSTVLLANSPFAAESVALWRRLGSSLELGWHPCLTLDRPVSPAAAVPTLVTASGHFRPLGGFLARLARGKLNPAEIERELRAQYAKYRDLVGGPPANVNGHHHVHIFRPVADALDRVLAADRPYVRRVVEPWRTLAGVPGARVKRVLLSRFGKRSAARQAAAGFPGNDWLLGITDPPFVHRPRFFARWLKAAPNGFAELTCHPGFFDHTLAGRDGTLTDGQLHRRAAAEYDRLRDASFREAVERAGFAIAPAGDPRRRAAA